MLHGSVWVPAAAEGHTRGAGTAIQVTRDRQVAGQGSQVTQEAGKIEIYFWLGTDGERLVGGGELLVNESHLYYIRSQQSRGFVKRSNVIVNGWRDIEMVFNLCSRNIRTFKIPLPPFLHRSGRVHYTVPHLSLDCFSGKRSLLQSGHSFVGSDDNNKSIERERYWYCIRVGDGWNVKMTEKERGEVCTLQLHYYYMY